MSLRTILLIVLLIAAVMDGRAHAACDSSGLADCLGTAQKDYSDCVQGCPAGATGGVCRGRCATAFSRAKQDCNTQFGVCAAGKVCCSDACADLGSDPQNCGACGKVCPAGICQNGVCGCSSGLTQCGGACVNLGNDPKNCGTCGAACVDGQTCQKGVCGCPPGLTNCGGACKDPSNDPQNCGACGNVCPGGRTCQNGQCGPKSCDSGGLADCLGTAQKDYSDCVQGCPAGATGGVCRGRCATAFSRAKQDCITQFGCPKNGMTCQNGACVCKAGLAECASGCSNLSGDPRNCGACGNVCPGGKTCSSSACSCPSGSIECAGVCRNPSNDPQNCGTCGNVCASGQICAYGACAAQVRVRQDITTLSTAQIDSLKRGLQVMMDRSKANPNDPTGYTYQANMHGTSTTPAASLWNQCQHASFYFLSWHRMYVYYFERILRAASGDPTLALPYWNYKSPSERTLPPPFLQPADSSNPLYVSGRAMNNGQAMGPGAVDDSQAFAEINFETPSGASFGGNPSPPIQFDSGSGQLELQPHNVIHCQVGGLMCNPFTAARDPIFWLHHGNIDRLWKRWLDQGGGRADPTGDATWMNTPFSFYDETGSVVTRSGKDILHTVAQLGYRYDDDPPTTTKKVSAPVKARPFPPTPPEQMAVSSQTKVALGSESARVQLQMPPAASTKITRLLDDKKYQHAVILNLEGVEIVDNSGGVYYEVYVNLPANETPAFDSIHHVGNLSLFLSSHAGMPGMRPPVSFDLTRSIRTMRDKKIWDGSQITVTFVARGLLDPKTQQPLPLPPGARATIARIVLVAR